MSKTDPIPSFKSPPLNEVVLGVQYDTIEGFNITTYGLLWENFKIDFPNIEHHIPLGSQFEKIGGRRQPFGELLKFNIEPLISAPLPRAWFISENGQELIQIQPDRFIRNWRRLDSSDEYPRYEKHMRGELLKNLNMLDSFYQESGRSKLQPNQCEISYINHIEVNKAHKRLNEIFTGWSDQYDLSNIADLEDINLTIKHIVKNGDGEFIGRLHVKITPAIRLIDDSPIFVIELTLRGCPLEKNVEGIIKFMDFGRETIVRAFTKMTTPKMHKIWNRER
jgi:uncharacterized protein (TIGR04255 family)